ncbi:MAG: hypothetical protein QMD00_02655, partial [Hadesarchaea archaeon]|nr:hypothetical protein [Hadesarchaea archaeon]
PEPKTEFVSPQNGMPFGTLLAMFGMLTTLFGGSIVGYIMREMKRQVKELSRDLERVKSIRNHQGGVEKC